jgi:TRAP-type C4-dicarboxylate transport system permease small subunit
MMFFIRKLDKHFEEYVLFVLLAVAVLAVAMQIFMRFVLGSSLTWSEELARYCFIWLIYVGIAYGVKKNRHITLDIVYDVLSEKAKKVMLLTSCLLFGCFAIAVIYYGQVVVSQIATYSQKSPAMGLNMAYVYAAAPFGMVLAFIRLVQNIWNLIKHWSEPLLLEEDIE